jgi:two-component system cell cycle sensor histidine kinase/response regulator CckA
VVAFEHPELGPVWVAVHEDITEQREAKEATQSLQARLVLADRMSSLGTLAAGVAHEINNPLTYVISNLELMARAVRDLGRDPRPSDTQPLLQMIEEASQGADRVRRIVKGLRAFSRADEDHPVSLDVQEVVESSINMTLHRLRQRARMVTEFERVPPVRADEAQLGQVFINLLVNAAQAIPEGNVQNNQIRVAVRNHPGDQVVVEVRDTGEGIPPDILGHIFDPFFTTKAVGEGTGLGLSISHGIVTSLGGRIEVESAIGEGSVFRIFLPAGAPAPSLPPGRPPPRPSSQEPSATVLVVDDDPMVAKAIQRSLDGCQVTLSANGREALELLASGRRFDLILCDLMMPVMTGMELHAQLAERLPEMVPRMVFMTGGAFTNGARSFLDRVPNRRIEKPFEAARLRALVAEMANNR